MWCMRQVMDGVEATRRIKRICPSLPVCALTACSSDTFDTSDFDVVLNKPLATVLLRKVLAQHGLPVERRG